jgi:hypothetical protein
MFKEVQSGKASSSYYLCKLINIIPTYRFTETKEGKDNEYLLLYIKYFVKRFGII